MPPKPSTAQTGHPKTRAPECPKCGKVMRPRSRSVAGKIRWECRSYDGPRGGGNNGSKEAYCYSTTNPRPTSARERGPGVGRRRVFKRDLADKASVYIITAAQNGTPIHEVFWNCLRTMAKHRGAELLVVPIRYKNPTSRWTASQANEEHWDAAVMPYLWNTRKTLNPNLVLLGDIKTQPTAVRPLQGFEGMTGSASAIIGHTKVQLLTVPAPSSRMAKVLTTTGACTVPNYTDSKAGKLGQFHHALAAVVVEDVGRTFHLRQLNFDSRTQSFTDLDMRYYENRAEKAPRALALVMGDTHVDFVSPDVERATWGKGGIVEAVRPVTLVWHDLLDGYAANPHHRGNPFNAIAKHGAGRESVLEEVRRACKYVKDHTPADTQSVIVPSNHDDFIRRWILAHDWKTDPVNAETYLQVALEMVRETKMTDGGTTTPSPLAMLFPQMVDMSNIRTLATDESFSLAGVELGMHGHRGPNGSPGSLMNHRRIGVRSIIGHSHSPGIEEGAYQVGTSTHMRLEYNHGLSSWLNAHAVLGADGKRQLIMIIDGEFRAHPRRRAN